MPSWLFFFYIVPFLQASMGCIAVRAQTPAAVGPPQSFAAMVAVWTRSVVKAISSSASYISISHFYSVFLHCIFTSSLLYFRQEEGSPASATRAGQQDPGHQLAK